MKKIISMLFIITGLIIITYPKISETYHNYQQKLLIQEWQENLSIINKDSQSSIDTTNSSLINEPANSDPALDSLEQERNRLEEQEKKLKEQEQKEAAKKQREAYIKNTMEGMLKIPKINLNLPVLHDATKQNLKISIASIKHTGKPGQIGNYCIAGHRSHTYGRNFNRLNEVEIGDIIEFNDAKNNYQYIVSNKFLVKPEEIQILIGNQIDKKITLITCHPMKNPTHRLIIQGQFSE